MTITLNDALAYIAIVQPSYKIVHSFYHPVFWQLDLPCVFIALLFYTVLL